MTPKEKAKELVDRFKKLDTTFDGVDVLCHEAKQCALICVDEILKTHPNSNFMPIINEWNEVKKEIQKL